MLMIVTQDTSACTGEDVRELLDERESEHSECDFPDQHLLVHVIALLVERQKRQRNKCQRTDEYGSPLEVPAELKHCAAHEPGYIYWDVRRRLDGLPRERRAE